jgi:hypothetical protein
MDSVPGKESIPETPDRNLPVDEMMIHLATLSLYIRLSDDGVEGGNMWGLELRMLCDELIPIPFNVNAHFMRCSTCRSALTGQEQEY